MQSNLARSPRLHHAPDTLAALQAAPLLPEKAPYDVAQIDTAEDYVRASVLMACRLKVANEVLLKSAEKIAQSLAAFAV